MSNPIKQWKNEHPDEYQKLVTAAGGRCCLCRKKFSRTRLIALDHRHDDGLVRGVPCSQCNEKLGYFHDDAGWFARAAAYLDSPPAVALIGEHYVPGSLGAFHQRQTP